MRYWDKDKEFISNYNPTKKYILNKFWKGGFNNVRMSFEIAACIAYRLNRILVIPDSYVIEHLKNTNTMDNFFEKSDYGITVISLSEFSKENNIPNDWKEIEKISKVYKFSPDQYYINLSNKKSTSIA